MSEVKHILRNLVEVTNLDKDTYFDADVIEGLLDLVMEGKLRIIYDNGQVYFQNSEVKKP